MTEADYIKAKLKELGELEGAATPNWQWRPTGMLPESMASLSVVASHNHTPYLSHRDARLATNLRNAAPGILRAMEILVGSLQKINDQQGCEVEMSFWARDAISDAAKALGFEE